MRRRIPGLALSSDVIVGFPSESESQFRQSWAMGPDSLAAYADRPIALAFLAVSLLSVLFSLRSEYRSRKRERLMRTGAQGC